MCPRDLHINILIENTQIYTLCNIFNNVPCKKKHPGSQRDPKYSHGQSKVLLVVIFALLSTPPTSSCSSPLRPESFSSTVLCPV